MITPFARRNGSGLERKEEEHEREENAGGGAPLPKRPEGESFKDGRRRSKRFLKMPAYLREDLPKSTLKERASLMDKYSLGLTGETQRKKRRSKSRRRGKKKKEEVEDGSPVQVQPCTSLPVLALISQNDLETVRSPRRPLRGPGINRRFHGGNQSEETAIVPFVGESPPHRKPIQMSTLDDPRELLAEALRSIRVNGVQEGNPLGSGAEKRIQDRIVELRSPKAAKAFLLQIQRLEAERKSSQIEAVQERRRNGECKILENMQAVQHSAEKYALEATQKREDFMKKLDEDLKRAHKRKLELEAKKLDQVQMLVDKRQSVKEKAELRKNRERSASCWIEAISLSIRARELEKVYQSLRWLKLLRYKAIIIQRNVRVFLANRYSKRLKRAHAAIASFVRNFVVARRARRKDWAGKLIGQFLAENKKNFLHIMLDWRRRVIRCQKYTRQFIACTQARVNTLSKLWMKHERILALDAREQRRKILQDHSDELLKESDKMQSSAFHKQMAKHWVRGVSVPVEIKNQVSTRDGKIFFPIGVHARQRQQAVSTLDTAPQGKGNDISSFASLKDTGRNVQFVMDIFLNDEFRSKLELEKTKPLSIEPVSRPVRHAVLREKIADARKVHQEHLATLKRESRVLEAQRIKVDVNDAHKLLHDSTNVEKITKNMFVELGRKPIVLLYSKITPEEMFKLVQKAQTQVRRSASTRKLIEDMSFNQEKYSSQL